MLASVLAILAGGSSRRFQLKNSQWQDKALIQINQTPLLIHLLKKSSSRYQDICISVNSLNRKRNYLDIIKSHVSSEKPNFIIDSQNTKFKGVFLGIYSVLNHYTDRNVQFVPSDRPFLDFLILSKMDVEKSGVSILQYENGMIEPLLSLYGSDVYFPEEFEQLPLTRADVLIRLSPHLRVYNATSILAKNNLPSYIFDNINIQDDFTKSRETEYDIGEIQIPSPNEIRRSSFSIPDSSTDANDFLGDLIKNNNFYLAFLWSQCFIKSISESAKGIGDIGKECLRKEYNYWLNNKMPFLALHALQDLVHFFPEEENKPTIQKIIELRTKIKIKSRKM
ncbi:MAG: NTP transferase domain-containing protein [Candidatus Heimdallarchaeota archaeon]|nr:NTP transferase domain-containing protein [Candidatus Heimdallarchaeota archaeon]MCK4878933.1 NTP transferase domain-containing protein [Candidatus Heimdallarchaeota archaeon]